MPARKINILSPEGDKTRRLHNILVNRVDPPPRGQCVTHVSQLTNLLFHKKLMDILVTSDLDFKESVDECFIITCV